MREFKWTVSIALIAAIMFMGLAMAEEWSLFKPLVGRKPTASEEKVPAEIEKMLKHFNAMMIHYYASAGDERFLQRVPASDAIRGEFFSDVGYLNENGIVQVMKPDAVKITSYRKVREGRYIVETEEEWLLHYEDGSGNRFDPMDRNFKVLMKYFCEKGPEGYRVARMEPRQDV